MLAAGVMGLESFVMGWSEGDGDGDVLAKALSADLLVAECGYVYRM